MVVVVARSLLESVSNSVPVAAAAIFVTVPIALGRTVIVTIALPLAGILPSVQSMMLPICRQLPCDGIAEIGEYSVPHESCNETVIGRDDVRAGGLIGTDQLAHVLRIEVERQLRRTDEITEHQGELAPLRLNARGGVGRNVRWERRLATRGDLP